MQFSKPKKLLITPEISFPIVCAAYQQALLFYELVMAAKGTGRGYFEGLFSALGLRVV
ncbi:hypothetical protein [Bradyrhizobium sp. NC92]|uniref:hypothetical protein n=1 Tax=Bradyrhizobium sp. (strain NC92) TaxID=55395 RepID=UPI0021AA7583|nr:hypothetical protein [Bradyrhizobium sp. NC92]UWU68015.1 hypothetical protein N2602_33540 [Bradyrhizobium sp. NC92]